MGRVEKLYAALDALVEEYRARLVKEFEKDGHSSYLHKCRDDVHPGRAYSIHGKFGGFEEANETLFMEKQIRQLCQKLSEPLPLPVQVLEEYVTAYLDLKKQKTKLPWQIEDFEREHKNLKKRMIQKLL